MMLYPAAFPCPLLAGYSASAAAGLVRTPFEAGNTRQRRTFRTLPHLFKASFFLSQEQYEHWLPWMNNNGWSWFQLKMGSHIGVKFHTVRIASDLDIEYVAGAHKAHWRVSLVLEWQPTIADLTDKTGWYIARTPVDPSVDWLIGYGPPIFPLNTTNPGTPLDPHGYV